MRTTAPLAVIAAVGLAVTAGCGGGSGGGSGGSGGSSDADGNTTLTWAMWSGGTAERDAWQAAADAVHEADPSLTVELETSSFDEYFTKMATRIGGGSAPCIVSVQSLRLGALQAGLLPLDDLIASSGEDMSDFTEASLAGLQGDDGSQYALPYDDGPMVMLYNKERFAEAGVPEPQIGWGVEEFEQAAQSLSQDGAYGVSAFPSDLVMFSSVLARTGVQPVSEEGELQLTDPALVDGVSWYGDLVHDQQVAPEVAGVDSTAPYNAFIAGTTAMVPDGPWDLLNIQSQSDFEVGVVTLPAGEDGPRTLSAGSGFGVSSTCPEPEAAFEAIRTLTGTEVLSQLAADGRALPSRTSAQQAWFDNAPAGAEEALSAATGSAEPMRVTDDWAQVGTAVIQFVGPVLNGSSEAGDALEQIQAQYGGE